VFVECLEEIQLQAPQLPYTLFEQTTPGNAGQPKKIKSHNQMSLIAVIIKKSRALQFQNMQRNPGSTQV
jgi:hypothetical protein